VAKIKGAAEHLKRMRSMTLGMRKEASKLIYVLADMHATEAAISVTTGAVSGKNHVASAPGDAPNADTHFLDRSIHVERTGQLTAESVADAPYAARLEFGDDKIAARPFMQPAAKKIKQRADKILVRGVQIVVRGGKL
jgi:HK97 gp10 family phage protein